MLILPQIHNFLLLLAIFCHLRMATRRRVYQRTNANEGKEDQRRYNLTYELFALSFEHIYCTKTKEGIVQLQCLTKDWVSCDKTSIRIQGG